MPMEEIRRDLRILLSYTSVDAVQKARLNNTAPTCFVALKIRIYIMLKEIGDDCSKAKNTSPK
jgi:hypothetical protein